MTQFEKHFTLKQANDLVPWVRSIFFKMGRILEAVMIEQAVEQPLPEWHIEATKGGKGNGHGNGHGQPSAEPGAKIVEMDQVWSALPSEDKLELINGMMRAVQEEGIVIQDVRQGLVDFPALREGEEILLCYRLSDGDRIGFWHDLTAGFAGRRPIDDKIA
jgi:hypothetical protein